MRIIKKILKYLSLILLSLVLGISIWILFENSESDFDDRPRKSTQYWELKTGSKIAYTHLKSETDSSKSTIVYLHGGPGGYIDNSSIEIYKEISKEGFDVYLYDQIGCGLSERLKNPVEYSFERHSQDLKEILEKTNSSIGMYVQKVFKDTLRNLINIFSFVQNFNLYCDDISFKKEDAVDEKIFEELSQSGGFESVNLSDGLKILIKL